MVELKVMCYFRPLLVLRSSILLQNLTKILLHFQNCNFVLKIAVNVNSALYIYSFTISQ